MPIQLAVVCEAEGDFCLATTLTERLFCEHIDWVTRELFRDCPLWVGAEAERPFLLWTELNRLYDRLGLRKPQGHFGGVPAAPEAAMARKALVLVRRLFPKLDGVLLVRDDDGTHQRRQGFEQARADTGEFGRRVVIALALQARESWVLAGFDPIDQEETERLRAETEQLGFDPRRFAERLHHKEDGSVRSAKRVLRTLTADDLEREARCWEISTLEVLRERGERSGLREFLDEVAKWFVMLFQASDAR